mmetsp:Transcript_24557/g.70602  ORF Transcript_24557/g.70602 Transcript_24557/m.70602 type:complete len:375 (-) Transcript_24557:2664-3788(-)
MPADVQAAASAAQLRRCRKNLSPLGSAPKVTAPKNEVLTSSDFKEQQSSLPLDLARQLNDGLCNGRHDRCKDGADNELVEEGHAEDPGHLDARRDYGRQPLAELQCHGREVQQARRVCRHDQGREAILGKVLEVDGHSRRNEHNIRERHGQVHDVVHKILQDLHPHKAAVGAPEGAAAVVKAFGQGLARAVHDAIEAQDEGGHQDPLEPTGFVGDLCQNLEDVATGVEADPIAWNEDESVANHAVPTGVLRIHPPAAEVVREGLCPRKGLPRAKALCWAGAAGGRAVWLPSNVEVNESWHENPDLRGDHKVHLLQTEPVHGAEHGAHVNKDWQVPHGPIEVKYEPEHQEEWLAVCKAVGPHGARVVKAVEEGQR